MLEVFKYIDKVKGLNYVLEVAKARKVSQSKLCEGIYDPSNFYRICKNPTERNINNEKLNALFSKLNIGKDEIMGNCTIFSIRTLEIIHLIEGGGKAYKFEKYPEYLAELEMINEKPVVELQQFILWMKGNYELNNHNYELAINHFKEALHITKKEYLQDLEKKNRFTEIEMYLLNVLSLSEFFLTRDEKLLYRFKKLLELEPMFKNPRGYICISQIIALILLERYSDASYRIVKAVETAKEDNRIGILAILNYLDGYIQNIVDHDDSKLKKATIMLEAHGVDVDNLIKFYHF